MNCKQYWELSASEDATEQARAERHFAQCASCQADRRSLETALGQLAEHPPLVAHERQLWLAAATEVHPVSLQDVARPGLLAWAVPTLAAVAIVLLAAFVLSSTTKREVPPAPSFPQVAEATSPTYSPISIVPLTLALCFGQIERDLQTSAARVEEVSEAVALIEVQRDVQATLERARHWEN